MSTTKKEELPLYLMQFWALDESRVTFRTDLIVRVREGDPRAKTTIICSRGPDGKLQEVTVKRAYIEVLTEWEFKLRGMGI